MPGLETFHIHRPLNKNGSACAGSSPCTPVQAIAMSRHRRPRRLAPLVAMSLAVLAALVLSACADAGAAQEPVDGAADVQRAHSAAQACPPGHAVVWTGPQSMECLRELP